MNKQFPNSDYSSVVISSKKWSIMKKAMLIHSQENQNQVHIKLQVKFEILYRFIQHFNWLKQNMLLKARFIAISVMKQSLPYKQINLGEMSRIGVLLSTIQKQNDTAQLQLNLPDHLSKTISIKQLRFQCKKWKDCSQQHFFLVMRNIKEKIWLPLELSEIAMVKFNTVDLLLQEAFSIQSFLKEDCHFSFDLKLDSLNIGEFDLSLPFASSFVIFLDQMLSKIDTQLIKSVSFMAKQQLNSESLMKEYLFVFTKFLKQSRQLYQLQIILDFGGEDPVNLSKMLSHIVLESLSKSLKVLDLSFSNIGATNNLLLSPINQFLKEKALSLSSLSISIAQDKSIMKFIAKGDSIQLQEKKNTKIVRDIMLQFFNSKEMNLFVHSRMDISKALQFNLKTEIYDTLSACFKGREEIQKNAGDAKVGTSNKLRKFLVTRIQVKQIIDEKGLDMSWAIAINELFLSFKHSLVSVACDLSFSSELSDLTFPQIQTTRIAKSQQFKPFELMVIGLFQKVNYDCLTRVEVNNTLCDLSFSNLLLKSIAASNYEFIHIQDLLTLDKQKSTFSIQLGRKAASFLQFQSFIPMKVLICNQSQSGIDINDQIDLILKSKTKNLSSFSLSLAEYPSLEFFESFVNAIIPHPIPNIELIVPTKHFYFSLKQSAVVLLEKQLQVKTIRFLEGILESKQPRYLSLEGSFKATTSDQKLSEILVRFKTVTLILNLETNNIIKNTMASLMNYTGKNIHKIIIKGKTLKKQSNNCLELIQFMKSYKKIVLVDIYLKNSSCLSWLRTNSMSKLVVVLQKVQRVKQSYGLRMEVFLDLVKMFLI